MILKKQMYLNKQNISLHNKKTSDWTKMELEVVWIQKGKNLNLQKT